MADITVQVPQGFPVGTTLSLYVDRVGDIVPQGPPVSTSVIGADSSVTLTGLTLGVPHQAGAVIAGKWRGFLVEVTIDPATETEFATLAELEAHETSGTDVHGVTGTLAGDSELAAAVGAVSATLSDHVADTTGVHGVADTAALALSSSVAAVAADLAAAIGGVGAPNTVTGNYTLALTDAGKVIEVDSTGAKVVTVPTNASVAFPIGTVISVRRNNTGTVTIHPINGTVLVRNRLDPNGTVDRVVANQWSEVSLCKRATNEWTLVGDFA